MPPAPAKPKGSGQTPENVLADLIPVVTKTRFKELRSVFRSDAPSLMHGYIAQLMVLYEDLRIELYGITEGDLGKLDSLDARYRVHYFLRRSIGTWCEFAQAIRLLDQLNDFGPMKRGFAPQAIMKWDKAVRYFKRNERFVKNIRNDIGGHFGGEAARYAVENFRPGDLGKLEITQYDSRHAGAKLYFAGEIVAVATFRRLPGGPEKETWAWEYRRLLRIVKAGWRYATSSTRSIVAHYLWARFG